MGVDVATVPLLSAPPAANATITPASSYANSAWTVVISNAASAITVVGISVHTDSTTGEEFEIDVGTALAGASSGSETVVTTFRGMERTPDLGHPHFIQAVIPVSNIPSGNRVSMRLRHQSRNNGLWHVALHYHASATPGFETTAKPQKPVPSAANGLCIGGNGTAGAYTGWGELISSTATAIVATGFMAAGGVGNVSWEAQIGVGAAGSELPITTVRSAAVTIAGTSGPSFYSFPPVNIAQSKRVAIRYRKEDTSTAVWCWNLTYHEGPL